MKKPLYLFLILCGSISCFSPELLAQGRPYEGPDDPAGDVAAERAQSEPGVLIEVALPEFDEPSEGPQSVGDELVNSVFNPSFKPFG